MAFIRYRLEVVDRFLAGGVTTGYEIPDIETIALQFRKIFELVLMSTLCANREACQEAKKGFDKLWAGSKIVAFVRSLNPRFYPVPVERSFNQDPSTGGLVSEVEDGYLTCEELEKALGRCGDLLHADNPYGVTRDSVEEWMPRFRSWNQGTKNLLALHTAQLLGSDTQWWVVMGFGSGKPVQVVEMKAVMNRCG